MYAQQTPEREISSFARDFKSGRCRKCGRWRGDPYDLEVSRFFGGTGYDLVTKRLELPRYDLPQVDPAIAACFPDWKLVAEGGERDADSGALWTPETVRMLVAPGRWVDCNHELGKRRVSAVFCGSTIGKRTLGDRAAGAFTAHRAAPLFAGAGHADGKNFACIRGSQKLGKLPRRSFGKQASKNLVRRNRRESKTLMHRQISLSRRNYVLVFRLEDLRQNIGVEECFIH